MIVVDNDVISYYWLMSERTAAARQARRRDVEWAAPYLWRHEFRSVLAKYLRTQTLRYGQVLKIVGQAERDMRGKEHAVPASRVLKLVEQTGHSAYDCEYVALAQMLRVPLVTGDHKLSRLFPDTAILLENFVS